MAMDRDIAVAFVRAWARSGSLRGWEMMAATGARGLRMAGETPAFESFLLTEANPAAYRVLAQNAQGVRGARAELADAHRAPAGRPFDYVDLDPYGSPAPFAAEAISAVRPGGVLAVTATDLTVLAGAQPAACARRYGARPVRGRLGPEGGVRILLAYLDHAARSQGRGMRPQLAYVRGHHVRAYVELLDAPAPEPPIGEIDPVSWRGPFVGSSGPYGPLWLGPLFDLPLVRSLKAPDPAAEPRKTSAFLGRIAEEAEVDVPFYYESNTLAGALGLRAPPSAPDLIEGIRRRGYRAARTHARPEGIRTDAPRVLVEEITREAARG